MWKDAFEDAQAAAPTLPFDVIITRMPVVGAIVVAAGISPSTSRMRVPNISPAPVPAAILSATAIVVVIAVMAVAIPSRAIVTTIATASAASAAMAVAAGSVARPVFGIHAARIISL